VKGRPRKPQLRYHQQLPARRWKDQDVDLAHHGRLSLCHSLQSLAVLGSHDWHGLGLTATLQPQISGLCQLPAKLENIREVRRCGDHRTGTLHTRTLR
jgi:hypothetical protein